MTTYASRIDAIAEAIRLPISIAIAEFGIAPPLTANFPNGWPIVAGWPDAAGIGSVLSATQSGGYSIAVNPIEPSRDSRQKWLNPPVLTLNDGTIRQEVARRLQRVQITAWAATSDMRDQLADAIMSVVATDLAAGQILVLPDGTKCRLYFGSGPRRIDETITNAQTKRADILIDVDYGVLGAVVGYAVIDEASATIAFPERTLSLTVPPSE